MRTRTSRYGRREEIKEDANRHNTRSAMHPQVARQLDEADNQEATMSAPESPIDTLAAQVERGAEEFCYVCDKWLNFAEYGDDICAECLANIDIYSTCDVCGEPIDYCLGGHPHEYEDD